MEFVNCPICDIAESVFFYNKERDNHPVNFVICQNCGLVYQNPRLNIEEFKEYYQKSFRDNKIDENSLNEYIASRIDTGKSVFELTTKVFFNNKINYLKKIINGTKSFSVLDVGCGVGGVLVPYLDAGYKCKGIDIPSFYTKLGKERLRIDIQEVFISDFQSEEKFDIIILNHALEHFLDPVNYLKKIINLMKKNSILYVEVPDIERPYNWASLQYFFLLGHVFYYSTTTLEIIMNKAGLERLFLDSSSTPFMKNIFKKKDNFLYKIDSKHPQDVIKKFSDIIME